MNALIKNDGMLSISTGASRFEKQWKNKKILWSELLARLEKSQATSETHAEYVKLSKDKQDQIKDIGGFVGGHLREGKRKRGYVVNRQIVTLDLDFAPKDFWDQIMNNLDIDGAFAVYSTHKHSPTSPRFRLIMPIDREVTSDEYEAIARKLAEKIGIDVFDPTTFQPTRLMYWPSNSADVEPFFNYYDAPFASADEVLAEYPDWTDVSYWPQTKGEVNKRKPGGKQQDPLSKDNIVGAFCRTYTITGAIDAFLKDIYAPGSSENRYTYTKGSTTNGLVVYDGDVFAYSNHSTDPASMQLCNAFDLVRMHLFGDLGEGESYKKMAEFAAKDNPVKLTLANDQKNKAVIDFSGDNWAEMLEYSKSGLLNPSITNAILILQNDEKLKGIRFNELSGSIEAEGLPWDRPNKFWRDVDDSQLYGYVTDTYGVQFPESRFSKALDIAADGRRFNPLRDFIRSLPEWDGVNRVDTLLIDYLGADDTSYVRAITRKTLVGAINRVLNPGCKHDTILVLDGKTGIGKSTLLSKLGGAWFSDSLSLADTKDKTAAEKLQGVWIMEIGEMQGTRKADVDILKGFISRQIDTYRAAYGRVVERHPRTAIICGTTNSTTGFLRDTTGNRRFWPVNVSGGTKSVWDMTEDERLQIWAEAFVYASEGEDNYLNPELEKEATRAQQEAMEYDEREGDLADYLDAMLPENWYSWDVYKRIDFFQQHDELSAVEGSMKRTSVCSMEIFCECFGRPKSTWRKKDGYEIAAMMARVPGWERSSHTERIAGYGQQRIYIRITSDNK